VAAPLPPEPPRPLRITFVMHSQGYAKIFEPSLRLLARRGHAIHLVSDRLLAEDSWASALLRRLQADFPAITHEALVLPDADHPWAVLWRDLSRGADYQRYFAPRFAYPEALRLRARRGAPPLIQRLSEARPARTAGGQRVLQAVLRTLVLATPPGPGVVKWLRERRPDLLVLSPVIDGRRQPEFVRAASQLGIPCVACVRSWDNLSTKGLFFDAPDVVTVWNETQRREAQEMHGLPPERVIATGSQTFDVWFGREPAQDRETFMSRLGLDPAQPYVLYLCSSKFISGVNEADWVARWMAALRSRPGLERLGVLIRPHPKSGSLWRKADLGAVNVAIHPPMGAETDTPEAQDDFFDSIHHSAAVVGVNTSAMIEAAIVGRPVLSVLSPEFRNSQEDSIHFSYLRTVGGGAVVVDETLDAHAHRVAAIVSGEVAQEPPTRFVREFVRPHGLDRPAAPILADVIERAGALHVAPRPTPARARVLRPLLWRLAVRSGQRVAEERRAAHRERRRSLERERRRRVKRRARRVRRARRALAFAAAGVARALPRRSSR